jgi:hypothetical protein
MTEETATTLEQRLALLEQQTAYRKQRRKLVFLSILGVLVLVAVIAGLWELYQQHTSFSYQLKSLNAGYTLYAPSSTLVGPYKIDPASLKNNSGYVTYFLRNGRQTITVTEQKVPTPAPPLGNFEGFDKLDLAFGNGVVGTTEGRTISVIVTDAAIINITGTPGVSKPVISALALSLRPIN